MADLSELNAAQNVKLVGQDLTGTETNPVKSAGNYDLSVADGLSQGGLTGELTLTLANTSYEAKVGVSRLSLRKNLMITALDDMFFGYSNSVTVATGMPLFKNQTIIFSIYPDSTFQIWLIASSAGKKARIAESL